MDAEPIPFGYEIAGCVNGAPAALQMKGSVARGEVRFETEIACTGEPLLWDKQILTLAAIDPVVLMSLDPDAVPRNAAPEIFRVESGLFDDGEKAVGRFVLAGCWIVDEGRLVIRAQLVEGWLNFEALERVTHVDGSSPMGVLPLENGKSVATRTWAIGTSRGNSYSGTSVSRGSSLAVDQEARDRVLRLRWRGVGGGDASDGPAPRAYWLAVEGHAQS